jgi:membrane associated rhomboid family serine protease
MKRARAPFPLAALGLVGAILAAFAVELAGDGLAICARFGFVAANPSLVSALSSLFLHAPSNWGHVAGNLAVLLLVGSRVEQAIGSARLTGLVLAGGLAGAGLHVVVDPGSLSPLVGCSGALFAVLAVAAALYGAGMLAFVAVLVAINIAHAFGAPGEAAVSFGCHLGGFTMGTALVLLARLRGVDLRRAIAA